jgi:hypothetical protein
MTDKPKVKRINQLYGRPGNIIFAGKGQTIEHEPTMAEQEAYDRWMTPPMRAKMWTPQTQEAARAAFAAAWQRQEERIAELTRLRATAVQRADRAEETLRSQGFGLWIET